MRRASSCVCGLFLLVSLLPDTELKPVSKPSSVSSSVPNETMTGRPGEDVHLTYDVPKVPFDALEVNKRGLGKEYVFLLRDGRPDEGNQHPSYKGRVELVNGTVIIKNVTSNDSGVYEFHFITNGTEPLPDGNGSFGTNSSYNINLTISGPTAGDLKGIPGGGGNGTDEDRNNKDGGNEDGRNIPGGGGNGTDGVHSNHGGIGLQDLTGLAAGVGLFIAVVAVFIFITKCKTKQTELSSPQLSAERVNDTLVQKQHTPHLEEVGMELMESTATTAA